VQTCPVEQDKGITTRLELAERRLKHGGFIYTLRIKGIVIKKSDRDASDVPIFGTG
jgi:hypothetical protein